MAYFDYQVIDLYRSLVETAWECSPYTSTAPTRTCRANPIEVQDKCMPYRLG